MDEMRMMSIGLVGAGFSYRGFKAGLDRQPHFIASDAGTSDLGPLQLGTGSFNYRGTKQDLGTLIEGARSIGAPFIMGSAGTAGGDVQVDAVADIVRDIARNKGLSFRLALLRCEVDKSYVKTKLAEGMVAPMGPVPALTAEAVDRSAHVVAMMGVEPFTEALEAGADVIVGGRCTDPAIFAGPPLRAGFHQGLAWHAARTMDKGPLMTTPVQEGSCAFITLRADHFVAEPTKAGVVSTPRTVAAVSLYENADPYETVLPSGTLDITNARFEAIDERSVRVSGAEFRPTDRYTVKLEGAAPVGYRSIQIIAARDPALIEHIDEFYAQVRAAAERNLEIAGIERGSYTVRFRTYGRDGVMGPNEPLRHRPAHEVGILIEGVAAEQSTATAAVARHAAVAGHVEFPGKLTTAGNVAQPFPGGAIPAGEVYEWSVWHILEPQTWRDTATVEIIDL